MTNIENLVTDLETSEDMFKAGIKYETAFVWVRYATSPSVFGVISRKDYEADKSLYDKVINAFTAGEMMQVLPEKIGKHYFGFAKKSDLYFAFYGVDEDFIISFFDKLPHQALAKLCLWCKENNYV